MTTESNRHPLTVRGFLDLPVVRRARPQVLAGASRLDREVRWVHAGEVPNIAALLKGGELLLTTGMGIGQSSAAQRRFVGTLAEQGIAALAIEQGPSMPQAPASLVEAAEAAALPLISFRREVRFVEITEAVHHELIDQRGELLRRGDELHRRFTALMLAGATVPDILDELAAFVEDPVILERGDGEVAYLASGRVEEAAAFSAWTAFVGGHPSAPAAVSERVPMGRDGTWGRLVALAAETPLQPQDRVAVERAVGLIALALMREREEESLALRRRDDFLAGLPRSRAGEVEIATRAAELGFEPNGEALLPVALSPLPGRVTSSDPAWSALRSDVTDELERAAVAVLSGAGEDGEALLVLGLARIADRDRIADLLGTLVERAASRRLGAPATVCVAAPCADWLEVPSALTAAIEALAAAATMPSRPWHDVAIASTDRLLFALREQPELRRFAELRLRPLIDLDRRSRGDLVATLRAYCEHGGRKAETARALHVERQTLYHRLRRIEAALGADLDDGETLLSLHLALRAVRHLEPV